LIEYLKFKIEYFVTGLGNSVHRSLRRTLQRPAILFFPVSQIYKASNQILKTQNQIVQLKQEFSF